MRLGLYGGSFDPIHNGHVWPVRYAMKWLELDRVVYLPTARPPHKEGPVASPYARYSMVEIALLEHPDMVVSPLEMTGDTAFTVDSVEHFRRLDPQAELYVLLGSDSFAQLDTWRRWQELVQLARIGVLLRPGFLWEELKPGLGGELLETARSDRVVFLHNAPVPASSTAVRETIAAGERVRPELLSEAVLQYIRKYSLYR